MALYLLLVPLEVGDEDEAIHGVWVLIDDTVGLGLLVQNVVHPLKEGNRSQPCKCSGGSQTSPLHSPDGTGPHSQHLGHCPRSLLTLQGKLRFEASGPGR